jgi:glutaredoxin-like protein
MAFIQQGDAQALRGHLARHLRGPVGLDLFVEPTRRQSVPGAHSATCDEARALLTEVATLSDELHLRIHDVTTDPSAAHAAGVDARHLPVLVLTGAARGRVRFLGTPTGFELGTLLSALLHVSSGESGLAAATDQGLAELADDVHIRVFVTPTCPFCPGAARTAIQMATVSPHVTADLIEANEFADLADRYRVRGVPKTVMNDSVAFVGAQPETQFLRHVLRAGRPQAGSEELRAAR